MIRITMVVNRHEDRWEATFDFNTKNSSEYNCDLMMHFFQACIIDENLGATRVRKEVTDKGGQKYYQLKMEFKSRGQIAKAVALGSLRGRLNYNV